LERDGVEREEAEEWVDAVIGYGIGMASWLEEGSEKTAMDEGENVQCDEEVVLEKSEEETKSSVADWRVEEKMGSPDTGEDVQCDKEITLERTEEGDEKMTMNEGGDVRCAEEVILEESEEEAEHGVDRIVGSGVTATSRLVEEKEMGIPDTREDARRDEDIVLKRKRDRPRDMEKVRQRGVKDKGTKKSDEERSKIREGRKTSKLRGKLTKKDKRQLLQGMDKVFSRDDGLRRQHHQERHRWTGEEVEGGEWSHVIIEDMTPCHTLVLQHSLMPLLAKMPG